MPEGPDILFVLGTGRCGSTLVHEMLARHPDMGFVSNVDDNVPLVARWRGRYNNEVYRRVPAGLTRKGRIRFAPSEGYRILDREVSPILSMPFRDLGAPDVTPWLRERLRGFFASFAAAQRRPVFSHKFTGWPRARFLAEVFPEARFLNVVRDGRAVANSWLQMPWWLGYRGPGQWQFGPLPDELEAEWEASGRSHEVLAGSAWRILMDAFASARAEIPSERWMDVRYEDFLDAPEVHLGSVLDFAGLDWTPEFEAGVARHSVSAGRRDAFRKDLSASQLEQLERCLSPALVRWGYAD
ncbi:MAG: sulfotransferase [Actinobacteria bacterium ATB1]|nr:sulfotransferase [Actinobacteria bacterium ATB1]